MSSNSIRSVVIVLGCAAAALGQGIVPEKWREAAGLALGIPPQSVELEAVSDRPRATLPGTALKVRVPATGKRWLLRLAPDESVVSLQVAPLIADSAAAGPIPPAKRIHARLARELGADPDSRHPIGIWLATDPKFVDRRHYLAELVAGGTPVAAARAEIVSLLSESNARTTARGEQLIRGLGLPVTAVDALAPVVFAEATRSEVERLAESHLVDMVYAVLSCPPQLANQVATHRWDRVHDFGVNGTGVKVAIVESTAVAPNHPYLNVTAWYQGPFNVHNHPTAIAGIIGSSSPLYPGHARGVEIISANGGADVWPSHQAAATWALGQSADILNLSVGGESFNLMDLGDRYCDYQARYTATSIFIAAGNLGLGTANVTSPGLAWNCLTMGNFNDVNDDDWGNDVMWSESSWVDPLSLHGDREKPEIAANGTDVTSSNTSGGFSALGTGTSYSTPAIAGMAACLMQMDPVLKVWPETIRAIMMSAAWHNIEGATTLSEIDGAGGINGLAAYRIVESGHYQNGFATAAGFGSPGYYSFPIWLNGGDRARITFCWDSKVLNTPPPNLYSPDTLEADLDVYVRQGLGPNGPLLAQSNSFDNSYEIAAFVPPATGWYTVIVDDFMFNETSVPYGIAWSQHQDGRYVRFRESLPAVTANDLVGACIGNSSVGLLPFDPHNPGQSVVVAASSGFTVGLPLGDGRLIPVDYDSLTAFSLSAQPYFVGAFGTYDSAGHYGGYHLSLPDQPNLAGIGFELAAVTLDPGASNGIEEIAVPHHVTIAGHATNLTLTDDGSANVAIGFAFPFYGQTYTQCWINSNGNVTFGGASSQYLEDAGALIMGLPRIAVIWDDLNPAAGGLVRYRHAGSRFIVEWVGVPEYGVANSNNAILVLNLDGTIQSRYYTCGLQDAVVGIGPGAAVGATLNARDLSAGFVQSTVPAGTIHEAFDGIGSTFDLAPVFTPFSFLERKTVTFHRVSVPAGVVYRMTVDL